jgi:hypothetical protein
MREVHVKARHLPFPVVPAVTASRSQTVAKVLGPSLPKRRRSQHRRQSEALCVEVPNSMSSLSEKSSWFVMYPSLFHVLFRTLNFEIYSWFTPSVEACKQPLQHRDAIVKRWSKERMQHKSSGSGCDSITSITITSIASIISITSDKGISNLGSMWDLSNHHRRGRKNIWWQVYLSSVMLQEGGIKS